MKILLITDNKRFFRQHLRYYQTMNVSILSSLFESKGYPVEVMKYDDIINNNMSLFGETILYTSSQNNYYKSYIEDIIFHLSKHNVLVPSYDFLKAHEDKNYQEMIKRELQINSLNSLLFSSIDDVISRLDSINFPTVLKFHSGAGSKNVYKVENQKKLIKMLKKSINAEKNIIYNLKRNVKKYFFVTKYISELYDDASYFQKISLQPFVPNLDSDWKILVFGEKYYSLKRKVRRGDFRASGSGQFDYDSIPEDVILDFSKDIFHKMNVPFVSLDVAYNGFEAFLIEFQVLHFGPLTIINSKKFHVYDQEHNNWNTVYSKSNLEIEFVNSVVKFLEKRE